MDTPMLTPLLGDSPFEFKVGSKVEFIKALDLFQKDGGFIVPSGTVGEVAQIISHPTGVLLVLKEVRRMGDLISWMAVVPTYLKIITEPTP